MKYKWPMYFSSSFINPFRTWHMKVKKYHACDSSTLFRISATPLVSSAGEIIEFSVSLAAKGRNQSNRTVVLHSSLLWPIAKLYWAKYWSCLKYYGNGMMSLVLKIERLLCCQREVRAGLPHCFVERLGLQICCSPRYDRESTIPATKIQTLYCKVIKGLQEKEKKEHLFRKALNTWWKAC